jgi:hypothetical protein
MGAIDADAPGSGRESRQGGIDARGQGENIIIGLD